MKTVIFNIAITILVLLLVSLRYISRKKEWGTTKKLFLFLIIPAIINKLVSQLFIWLFFGLDRGSLFMCSTLVDAKSCGFWEWLINLPDLIFIIFPTFVLGLITWAIASRIGKKTALLQPLPRAD